MHVCGRAVEGPELGTWPPNSSRNHRPGWYRGGENGRRDARHSWLGGAGRLQVASGERRTVSMCHGPELHVVCSCRVMRGWAKDKTNTTRKEAAATYFGELDVPTFSNRFSAAAFLERVDKICAPCFLWDIFRGHFV